jgi:hypothetical protein
MRWEKEARPVLRGTGALQGGGDTPVLTLRYAASEVSTSAERHILHTFSYQGVWVRGFLLGSA